VGDQAVTACVELINQCLSMWRLLLVVAVAAAKAPVFTNPFLDVMLAEELQLWVVLFAAFPRWSLALHSHHLTGATLQVRAVAPAERDGVDEHAELCHGDTATERRGAVTASAWEPTSGCRAVRAVSTPSL
jgi:hypothetical protein